MSLERRTYTYKQAGAHQIKADVYLTGEAGPRPVIIWVHGGCLIMGHRGLLAGWQRALYLSAGFTVVSIDYRLAPETKLPAIIEDLRDACRWAREEGPRLFAADPARTAVIGHSAGGYLALMAGFAVSPRPAALVSFYGYGDIVGPWYSQPDPHYLQQPLVSRERALSVVGHEVISGTPTPHDREDFYLYCRQQGLWPNEVAGHDPAKEPDFFLPYCPVRNVDPSYPPTLLLHGDRDTDVPYQQSVIMREKLAESGVPHELVTIPGGEHGFDHDRDSAAVAQAFERVMSLLSSQARPGRP
jgi:acetyl esterase/lipase